MKGAKEQRSITTSKNKKDFIPEFQAHIYVRNVFHSASEILMLAEVEITEAAIKGVL